MEETKITELSKEDLLRSINSYLNEEAFAEGFTASIFNDGLESSFDSKEVREWLANPDDHQADIEKMLMYQYITNSNIFQMIDMAEILPTLNYKILSDEQSDEHTEKLQMIKGLMRKVNHKQLTRDLITQTIIAGTTCGLWVGSKKEPELFIFNDLEWVFPAYIKNNKWTVWLDLSWFDTMTEFQQEYMFDSLSPYVTESDYNNYKEDSSIRYLELPIERSICIRTHTLYRNQRLGVSWGTQSIFDLIHKEQLKNLEKSIANKVINSVAVLSLGNDVYHDSQLGKKKQKVYRGVKTALQQNHENGVTVVGIPHWSKLDFPTVKTDGLDPKKFNSINDDLNVSVSGLNNIVGGSSNYSAGKMSVDLFYRKIGVVLEQIETEVYQKLINLFVKKKEIDKYFIEYDKNSPLSTKDKVDILKQLNTSFGFSLKAVLDQLDGVDFDEYIQDTMYEQEVLELPTSVQPYMTSYTMSNDDKGGSPVVDEVDNPNTEKSKTTGSGDNPRPSTD